MKRSVIILLLLLFLIAPLVFAEDQAKVDNAYSCLEGMVKDKCSTLPLEDREFALLALAYNSGIQSECKDSILADANSLNSNTQQCWPKSGCKIKTTSLAIISLNRIGVNTDKAKDWLLNQTKVPGDVTWYLEIDSKDASSCTVKYDNSSSTSNTVLVQADKKVTLSGSGNCFSSANNGYWLQVSQSCIGRTFRVSCDKDFSTNTLYKKSGSDIWHVPDTTQTSSAGGTTENEVSSLCFKEGSDCVYEGSLWAALALQGLGISVSDYLPYLISDAPDNLKYNPYSFLNKVASSDEFASDVRDSQFASGFWDYSSGYSKIYDTALSILGLKDTSEDSVSTARDWLQSVQGADGCWPNVRDTSFVLYSAWPKAVIPSGGGAEITYCEQAGKYCMSMQECSDAGGQLLSDYACQNGVSSCCSSPKQEETCQQKDGEVCQSDEVCNNGDLVDAQNTSRCCINGGTCKVPETPGCEKNNYQCKSSCSSTEEEKTGSGNDCTSGLICCGEKAPTKSYWWVWLLIILFILLVLGIIFRNRIRVFLFNLRNRRGKSGPVQQTRPPFPPSAMPRGTYPRMIPRPMPQSQSRQIPAQKPKSKTDTELEETLKKLKEMSK